MIDEYGNEQIVGSKEFEEYLYYRMDKEFCNDISTGDMDKEGAIGFAHEFYGYALDLLAEVKELREEIKVLSKYRDIVEKYDDALLSDGDTDPRWSELYE